MIVMAMSLMNMMNRRVMMVLGLITMWLMIILNIIMTIYKFAKDENGEKQKKNHSIAMKTWIEAPVISRISLIFEPPFPIRDPH